MDTGKGDDLCGFVEHRAAPNQCHTQVPLHNACGHAAASLLYTGIKLLFEQRALCFPLAESPGVEACAIGAVAQLTMLRSLRLVTSLGDYWSPEALRPHASCVGRLSSLTALTHLYLDTPVLYEHHADSWHEQQHEGEEHEVWCEVREAHRAALLSALRCMPQLQQLECPTLWLRPSELPVQCTALTSLSLKGLLPPAVEDPQVAADSGAGAQAAVAAMPPQLQELTLRGAASPRALALLRPPSCLVRLDLNTLTFSVTDVTAEGRLHAASADAVGPAVRLLLSYRGGRRCYCNHMDIEYDGGPGRMQPREGAADSHMGWIRELNGLDVCRRLALGGVALSFGDLHCLGRTLGQLRSKYPREEHHAHDFSAQTCVPPGALMWGPDGPITGQ